MKSHNYKSLGLMFYYDDAAIHGSKRGFFHMQIGNLPSYIRNTKNGVLILAVTDLLTPENIDIALKILFDEFFTEFLRYINLDYIKG